MFSSFSRSCLLSLLLLSACSTGWSSLDSLWQGRPEPQTQAQLPKGPSKQAAQTTQNINKSTSRLDSQPWPPGMGEPLKDDRTQTALLASRPEQPPPPAAKSNKIQVALLLPLSGKNAPLGQAMLNAAQLAVFDMAPNNFELMPRDTGGTPTGAANAAKDAISSGAQLLIGPLFANDVTAVKPVVQSSNVNMLTLSTDVSLAEPGVYVMGFAPSPQVERVVAYAARQGAKRFAALISSTAYGKLVKKAFETAVQKNGGTIASIETPGSAQSMAAKKDEYDALLLPLGGEELIKTATQLAASGLDKTKVRLLGTGLWDEPGLGGRSELLVGGWYAASEPEAREAFIHNYKKTYSHDPPRLATLTYDATALATVLAAREGRFDKASLTNPSGFAGLDGIFRFGKQGLAERGLAINEITATGNRVIDPSPSTFAGTAVSAN